MWWAGPRREAAAWSSASVQVVSYGKRRWEAASGRAVAWSRGHGSVGGRGLVGLVRDGRQGQQVVLGVVVRPGPQITSPAAVRDGDDGRAPSRRLLHIEGLAAVERGERLRPGHPPPAAVRVLPGDFADEDPVAARDSLADVRDP